MSGIIDCEITDEARHAAAGFMIKALARTIVEAGICTEDEIMATMRTTAVRAKMMRSQEPRPDKAHLAGAISAVICETFRIEGV